MKTQIRQSVASLPSLAKNRLFHLGLSLLAALTLLPAPKAHAVAPVTPSISLSTTSGPNTGGGTMTITTSNLAPADYRSVLFGDIYITFREYSVSGNTITFQIPAVYAPVSVQVYVSYAGNNFTSPATYTYVAPTITTVTPSSIPAIVPTGGTEITLTGTDLGGVTGIDGFVQTDAGITPTSISDTEVKFTIPAGTYPVGSDGRFGTTFRRSRGPAFRFTFTRVGNPVLTLTRNNAAAGFITLRAPSGTFTSLTPAAAATQTSKIRPGTLVTLSTTARPGFLFSSWTDSENVGTELGRSFSFTMPEDDVSIDAEFIANPFATTPATSVFRGVISPDFDTPRSNATFGSVVVTVTGRTGDFSGNFLNDGSNLAIRGYFLGDGSAWFTQTSGVSESFPFASAAKVLDLALLGNDESLSLDCSIDANTPVPVDPSDAVASVIEVSSSSSGTALPQLTSIPSSFFNRASSGTGPSNQGYFNAILSPSSEGSFSIGNCHAHITISDIGRVNIVGKLSDGSSLLMSSNVCSPAFEFVSGPYGLPMAVIPLHSQLRTPGGTSKQLGGSLLGQLAIQDPSYYSYPADEPVAADPVSGAKLAVGGSLIWIRPAVTQVSPATTVLARETQIYTAGWPEGLPVYVEGSQYDASTTIQSALASSFFPFAADTTTPPPAPGNAVLEFTNGKLDPSISKNNFNINASTVAKILPIDRSYSLVLVQRTGQFSGSFTPNWFPRSSAPTNFSGVIIQAVSDPRLSGAGPVNAGYGAGFFISNQPTDTDPESGNVSLSGAEPTFVD